MEEFLQKNLILLAGLLLGLIFLGGGLLSLRIFQADENPQLEILGEETVFQANTTINIKVEIAGSVVKPGVYELPDGSRVNDLLTAAGGLAGEADRDWLAKNLNLAQKLADGVKIFIPEKSADLSNLSNSSNLPDLPNKININSASVAELDTLWGIGPVTAQKIIDGRPWSRPEELLEKKVIKKNVWESIKDQVSVY